MRPYVIAYPHAARMERMVKRNEKALLRQELGLLQSQAEGRPIESTALYLAACHKHGAGVARMLMEAGVVLTSEKPLRLAVARGLQEVAITLAGAMDGLSALDPDGHQSDHPLTAAARAGNLPLLRVLFPLRCQEAWTTEKTSLAAPQKASQLLGLMAMQPGGGGVDAGVLAETVDFLLSQGGDVNYASDTALSMTGRMPIVFHAAMAGNLPVLKALVERGAHVHATLHPGSACLHPCPNAAAAALHGWREQFEKNKKTILPMQWDVLDYLAGLGIGCALGEDGRPFSRLPLAFRQADRERVESLMARAMMVAATAPAVGAGNRPRL